MGQYLHALNSTVLPKTTTRRCASSSATRHPAHCRLCAQQVLDFIAHMPVETLKEHPHSLLVLMRSMFTWRQIPKMLDSKELLLAAITEHPDWPES